MIDVPAQTPTSPVTTVRPVLVTVEEPRTPKVAAVPKFMFCANDGETAHTSKAKPRLASKLR